MTTKSFRCNSYTVNTTDQCNLRCTTFSRILVLEEKRPIQGLEVHFNIFIEM